jgi:hypothetical protein
VQASATNVARRLFCLRPGWPGLGNWRRGRLVRCLRQQLHSSFRWPRGGEVRLGLHSSRPMMAATDLGLSTSDPYRAALPTTASKELKLARRAPGEVAKWSKAPVSATGDEGSNPSFTPEREYPPGAGALLTFNNDRVMQRRWVGQRMANRPTSPAPQPRCAAAGRWSGALCRQAEAADS